MDPLTAFGLSASIVQFVGFASGLISKTKEIYASADSSTSQVSSLETVYGQLRKLSSELQLSSQRDPKLLALEGNQDVVNHIFAINDLSQSCKEDCDRLLDITSKLKSGGTTKRRWQSFRLALKTVWKGNEIADLEQRLHYTQTTLTLQVYGYTRYLDTLSSMSAEIVANACDYHLAIGRASTRDN